MKSRLEITQNYSK